ncbi:hypothetical protein [uncultured Dokdonia sp.]|uniref:hypothetical protein n=1 Tax=unclassified Dokdonia TaxID=2615033 RepID=UPI00261114D1|nr:hypothetical protein [uncultured Dokdonia sp.]|tara:strand:+ start:17001 stop:17168 length:168 start_codon:yes stop_codon:yes gene_type:complete
MNTSKLIHKNTILLLAIFLVGVIVAVVYINAAFEEETNSRHTTAPATTKGVSYHS